MPTTETNPAIAKALRSLEGAWKQAEPRSFDSVKDGDYLAKLANMYVGVSKNERLQVISVFKIQDGAYKGAEVWRFDGIDNDVSMSWFKGYCEILGVDVPENISDLPDALEEFVANDGSLYNITVKTKDEFQNVLVRGVNEFETRLEPEDETAQEEPAAAPRSSRNSGRAETRASRTTTASAKRSRR